MPSRRMSHFSILKILVVSCLSSSFVREAKGQIFEDWPADSILVTDHVLGYLGHGVSFCDFDGDGLDDITFGHYDGQLFAYQSQGDGTFLPFDLGITNTSGEIKAVTWVDVDGDGDLDLFVTQRLAPNRLWIRDTENMLAEVPNAGGLAGGSNERTYGSSWGDYDNDGDLDVYCCKFHSSPVNTETNQLFQNLGGVDLNVNFIDVTEVAGVGNGVKPTFQSSWIDLNNDGWLDLHVINDRTIYEDALYINLQDGTFEDVSADIGLDLSIYSMSSSFADYDKDLDWDVFISNGAASQNRLMNCLISSEVSDDELVLSYQNVANQAGVVLDELAWAGLWMDADNNGWQDLLITTGTSFPTEYPQVLDLYPGSRTHLFTLFDGQLPFVNASEGLDNGTEFAFAAAYGDADNDGALEVVVHRMGATARLLHGIPFQGRWIQVELVGQSPNTRAIGTKITAWRDGMPDMRMVQCGTHYLGQSTYVQHFGMGNAVQCDSLTVVWPTGQVQSVQDLPINARIQVEQPTVHSTAGCTYISACNYSSDALTDDGSCDFSCLCQPSAVWSEELQQCLAECTQDLTGDGVIGVGDLIAFLTLFGEACDN